MADQQPLVQFKDLFYICDIFYKTIGVQPIFSDGKQSVFGKLMFWSSFWNLAVSFLGEWIFLFSTFGKNGSFLQLTALAPCLCFVMLALNEMILIKIHRGRVMKMVAALEELFPKSPEDQLDANIVQKKRQFDRFLYGFSSAFVVLIMTFNFIPFTVTLINYLNDGVWKKELPYFIWYPFDELDDKYFPYIYAHQTWAGFTTVFAILAENFLIGSTAFQICIQFERICKSLEDFQPHRSKTSKNSAFLRQTIVQHNYIIDMADEFADIISETLFIHYICSSLNICFAGFQVMAGENFTTVFKFMLFLICSLIQIIMMGVFGNQIMENSSNVSSAVYDINWLDGDVKFRRTLLMIMIRAKKPQRLTGLKYTTISLRGFTKILGTSYSYFALIRTMYYRL